MFYKHSDYEGKRRNHQFLPITFAHTPANLIPRLRICHGRGGSLPHRSTPPFLLCGSAVLLAVLLSILFAFPAGAQAPPNEEVKPVPLLTGSTGFITTFDGGEPHLHPIVTPLVLVPIGGRWIFETRATFETDMMQLPGRSAFHGTTPGNLCSFSTSGNRRIFSAWAPGRAVECFWLPCLVATTNPAARHPIRICSFHRGKRLLGGSGLSFEPGSVPAERTSPGAGRGAHAAVFCGRKRQRCASADEHKTVRIRAELLLHRRTEGEFQLRPAIQHGWE